MTDRLCAVHVIAGLDPVHGGPSYSVPRLCGALAAQGVETMLLSVSGDQTADGRCSTFEGGYGDRRFALHYAHIPVLRDLRHSSGLVKTLRDTAGAADVIHNHGLWLMPNVQAAWAARREARPLIVSPRGMLAPAALTFSRLKKRIFWRLAQGPAIRDVSCIHATSEQEYEEIRAFGLTNPVAIVRNGIDLPDLPGIPTPRAAAHRVVLSLGRIHPKKGLDRLLYAWAKVGSRHPGWRLKIVGPAEAGHDRELQALAKTLGLAGVSIGNPVFGDVKQAEYRHADIFVLPTLNDNFGVAVAEALAAGTPVISTKGAPWSGLESEGCGWWVDHGVEPLAAALAEAMARPCNLLKEMGAKGRAWMARDYSWERVAREMLAVYRWASGSADAPATIRFG